ncbi:MAG: twin-arginine translocase subunit TatC [Chloroflexota bacterium]
MRSFFSGIWRVITFPFRLIFNILAAPLRGIARFRRFLNTEPDERPLAEVFADLTTEPDVRQMMWEQVGVLRMHLLRALLVLALTVILSFSYARSISTYLMQPLQQTSQLETIEVTEGVGVFMKIALTSGIALALPYILFEAWMFAAPGLRVREKKFGLIGIPLATLLFVSGVAFTYFILPTALGALQQFNEYMGFATNWRPNSYFSFVTNLMLWMGIFFEFPLVIYILSAMGLVAPAMLAQQWRLAIVIISVIAAAVTPTIDPVNMGLVMIPMILLYFISIGLSFLAYAGRRKAQEEAEKIDSARSAP